MRFFMDFPEFSALFDTILAQNGFSAYATAENAAKFHELTTRMLQVNEYMNLTAIKEPRAVILRHYADSLTVAPLLPQGASICDVGCGAGFPSLPLAIARPDLKILSLDSTAKRIRYVQESADLLGCKNLTALAARAEDAGKGAHRERYDVCTARAVAALPVLAELCLPLVRTGGKFLAMKAKRGEEEWESAARAISRLGGKLIARHEITLKNGTECEERIIFEIEKCKPTPKEFPRAYAKITKSPL
jgi:16S rRNA (guanine527-N7)-methyltransferase